MSVIRRILTLAVGLTLALGVAGGLAVAAIATQFPPAFPDTPYPDVHASDDPEVVARGEYLFHAVAHCSICHSPEEDWEQLSSGQLPTPIGGMEWELGPLGTLRSRNLTPHPETGLSAYTDAELARVIRTGIRSDHTAAPLMISVGPMADEDITAIVSYVRSLPPVAHEVPPTEIGLVGKVLLQLVMPGFIGPKEMEAPPFAPEGGVSIARGRYLAEGPGGCVLCHTEMRASPDLALVGPRFAGNPEPEPVHGDPSKEYVTPNLTPGGVLATYSEDTFAARLRGGRTLPGTKMPWEAYQLLTEEDARSIYRFLASLEPVDRDVGPIYRDAGWTP